MGGRANVIPAWKNWGMALYACVSGPCIRPLVDPTGARTNKLLTYGIQRERRMGLYHVSTIHASRQCRFTRLLHADWPPHYVSRITIKVSLCVISGNSRKLCDDHPVASRLDWSKAEPTKITEPADHTEWLPVKFVLYWDAMRQHV